MNYIRCKFAVILLGLFAGIHLQAQHAVSFKINEASVISKNVFSFDYGKKYLFNNSSESFDVAADYAHLQSNDRLESIKTYDRLGFGMTITAMGVVFLGLIGLYLLFYIIGSIAVSLSHKRVMKTFGMSKEEAKGITKQSGEIYAAISLAIYEATELHDEENAILTIKNTVRNYSPWSSKIYTLREAPKK